MVGLSEQQQLIAEYSLIIEFLKFEKLTESDCYVTPFMSELVRNGEGVQTTTHRIEEMKWSKSWEWMMYLVSKIEQVKLHEEYATAVNIRFNSCIVSPINWCWDFADVICKGDTLYYKIIPPMVANDEGTKHKYTSQKCHDAKDKKMVATYFACIQFLAYMKSENLI